MKHASRVLTFVFVTATTLLVTAVAAVAEYPPTPPPSTAAPGQQIVTPSQRAALAFTGSDPTWFWVGLAAFVVGLVLVVATRRRAAIRRRGSLASAA